MVVHKWALPHGTIERQSGECVVQFLLAKRSHKLFPANESSISKMRNTLRLTVPLTNLLWTSIVSYSRLFIRTVVIVQLLDFFLVVTQILSLLLLNYSHYYQIKDGQVLNVNQGELLMFSSALDVTFPHHLTSVARNVKATHSYLPSSNQLAHSWWIA